jgi:hypothetical protein
MTATPEHVLWAIECDCAFRSASDWTDPEQTWRELRPLRAYSEAIECDRLFEGICLDRSSNDLSSEPAVKGFPLSEVVNMFGDEACIDETCRACLANVSEGCLGSLAGCHGWFLVSDLKAPVDNAIQKLRSSCVGNKATPLDPQSYKQGFYGVWMTPIWHGSQLSDTIDLFDIVLRDMDPDNEQLLRFVTALHCADQHDLPVHVKLMPQGRLEGKWWHVVEHCPRCRARWVARARHCSACEYAGNPSPARKRHARGTRPFISLERLVGKQNVASFLSRYASRASSTREASIGGIERSVT